MADTATVPAEAAAKKRLPVKLIVIATVVLAVLAAAYVFVLAPGDGDAEVVEPPPPEFSEEGGESLVVDAGTTVSVGGDERHYAMLTYSVRPAIDADVDAVQLEFARMRSEVQRLMLGYDADTLLTPEGVDRLEGDIRGVADAIWQYGEVVDVYVENLVVQ